MNSSQPCRLLGQLIIGDLLKCVVERNCQFDYTIINWFDLSNDRNYKLYLEKLESFKKDCPEQITNILQDSVNI